jgi:GT2 family glycosyltransferase
VHYLPQTENRWFCAGNNIGIRAAQGEYVLLLNPDTVPQPDALAAMVDFMDSHPDYRGVTLQLRYPDGQIQRTCSHLASYAYLLLNHTLLGFVSRSWHGQLNRLHWTSGWNRDTDYDVEVMPGSCLMMRRSDLVLDEDLRLYFPEDDLGQRFKDDKFRFLSQTFITHHEKAVTQSWTATRVYYHDLLLYTRKQHGMIHAMLLWLLSRPLLWAMALKQQLMSR